MATAAVSLLQQEVVNLLRQERWGNPGTGLDWSVAVPRAQPRLELPRSHREDSSGLLPTDGLVSIPLVTFLSSGKQLYLSSVEWDSDRHEMTMWVCF